MEREAFVTLVNYTPNPEKNVALAARMCYSSQGVKELAEELEQEEVERLIDLILKKGHDSVLEMASFSFAIEGISRVASHQLVRHRIGCSYAQKSQRYQEESSFFYILPDGVGEDEEALKIYQEAMDYSQRAYNRLVEMGIHQEEARYLLPGAVETKIFLTMNARSLHHFFGLRCCNRAQKEIRQVAYLILEKVKEVSPLLFKKAGPPCITHGYCREGDLSCGRLREEGSWNT